jgi:hypothetical protein
MVKVVNIKKEKYDVYIGRGSPFGNPYTHLSLQNTKAQVQVKSREEAIEKYREYFYKKIEDPEFLDDILRLKDKVLGCYCAPKSCHGHIIAEFLDKL